MTKPYQDFAMHYAIIFYIELFKIFNLEINFILNNFII